MIYSIHFPVSCFLFPVSFHVSIKNSPLKKFTRNILEKNDKLQENTKLESILKNENSKKIIENCDSKENVLLKDNNWKRKNGRRSCDLVQMTLLRFAGHACPEAPVPPLSIFPDQLVYPAFRLAGVNEKAGFKVGTGVRGSARWTRLPLVCGQGRSGASQTVLLVN
jgi:hypothetical protein